MANKSQENGTTILLGLEECEVGTVAEEEGKIIVEVKTKESNAVCPYCSSVRLYRHGSCEKGNLPPYYRPTAIRVFPMFSTYSLGVRPASELCGLPLL